MTDQPNRGTVGGAASGSVGFTRRQRGERIVLPDAPEEATPPEETPAPPAFRTGSTMSDGSKPKAGYARESSPKGPKVNRYTGKCPKCGFEVAANEGLLKGGGSQPWVTTHRDGECPEASQEALLNVERNTTSTGETLFDGDYTIETALTESGHRTFQIKTQDSDEEFMPGRQIISYLSGPDNESDWTRCGHVVKVDGVAAPKVWNKHLPNTRLVTDLAQFFSDPSQAILAARCFRCGRKLTVPTSVHNGYGPECIKKV